MKAPTWDIMIASLEHRHEKLERLLDVLAPQLGDGVGVIIYRDNLENAIGVKRQKMLEASTADYVCACDDDDMVASDYVRRTRKALKSWPDYVGWQQVFFDNGVRQKRVFHSLAYNDWSDDEEGYYRGITHSNPIRRKLALLARFDRVTGAGEDRDWCKQMESTDRVETEVFVPEPVHICFHSSTDDHLTERQPLTEHPPLLIYPHVRYIDG